MFGVWLLNIRRMIADGSGDEKRLEKAAERKARLRKRKRLQRVRVSQRLLPQQLWSGCATPRSSFGRPPVHRGSGAVFSMWRDEAFVYLLPQDAGPGEEVVSFSHAEA